MALDNLISVGLADGSGRLIEINPFNLDVALRDLDGWLSRYSADGVVIKGFKDTKIDFLGAFAGMAEVRIIGCSGLNICGFDLLSDLRRLVLCDVRRKAKLDFSGFHNLEYLSVDWGAGVVALDSIVCLKDLRMIGAKIKSFEELAMPSSLVSLEVLRGGLQSLNGLGDGLRAVKLLNMRKGVSLAGLNGLKNLEKLDLEGVCINDFSSAFEGFDSLKELYILNCNPIPTLKWITSLRGLRAVSIFGTKVVDRDTSPLLGLRKLKWIDFDIPKASHDVVAVRGTIGV